MPFPLRFGAFLHQNMDVQTLISRWEYLDTLGLDHLWITDHFNPFWSPESDWYEAWVLLGALAMRSQHSRLGTLVTPIPYRNPALLAQMAMTLDHLSGGRLELGVGSGAAEDLSYPMLGITVGRPGAMVERAREAIQILDQLLREGLCTFHGTFYTITGATIRPSPQQKPRPPLTIAAHGPRLIKIAAQFADTWNTHVGTVEGPVVHPMQALEEISYRTAQFRAACEQVGREASTVRRSIMILAEWPHFAASAEAFLEHTQRYLNAGITDLVFPGIALANEGDPVVRAIVTQIIPDLRRQWGDC